MSTENDGAAETPAAGPAPRHPSTGTPHAVADEDFSPTSAPEGPAARASGDEPPKPAGEPSDTAHQSADEPRAPHPEQPPVPPVPPTAHASGPAGPAGGPQGPEGPGYPGSGQTGQWGTPPPQPPYGGGPGGPQYPWGAPPGPEPRPEGKRRGGLIAAVLVAALVAGGIGGGIGFWASDRAGDDSTTISSSSDPEALNRSPKSVAGIASKTLPSVVTITSSGGGEEGTGTGFVYDKEGHILTNNHVVANGSKGGELSATFSDGKKYTAEVVGEAQGYDIAVLKLRGTGDRKLTPLPLAKSGEVQVGDATIAIGAPFGLSGTVTTGIVSAKNRPVASSDGQGAQASYMSALQTDASINPGNSGGPLLNAQGAVIGVNSAIQSGGGDGLGQSQAGSVGLGFAIPVSQAQRVAGDLIRTGQAVYAVIGATVDMGGGERGQQQSGSGATISKHGQGDTEPVPKGSPADKAGLKPGDVITKFDDTLIDSGPTLIATIWTHKPGEKVKLTYERDGKEKTVELTLGSREGESQ
ncbi:S1C family serine protease [Streptomyces sulphureus]|uniref:S1C family serine protease n=1 Tax=Streptomyces sulphureus TaxID=47758 RepID=UPI0003663478|nr:trypsin-like peptidase domain-containing protein [Streptomyces sulphureus]